MRIIVIPDVHGRDHWKKIVEEKEWDKVVFLADYWDSFDISFSLQKNNYEEIIEFKLSNQDKVHLLLGNHDFHYIRGVLEKYSGYQSLHALEIQSYMDRDLKAGLFEVSYISGMYLMVHAGITDTWCKESLQAPYSKEALDDILKYTPSRLGFRPGRYFSGIGDEVCQSPIWVRPASLNRDLIKGYTQIVGHTVQKKIDLTGGLSKRIICIDTLHEHGGYEYLVIEDGKLKVEKL